MLARVVGEGMDWLAELYSLYCNTMNVIHYMHDKYNYKWLEMALHDTHVRRRLAFGISGLSVAAFSLSAIMISHARVTPVLDARGLMTQFRVAREGWVPQVRQRRPPRRLYRASSW